MGSLYSLFFSLFLSFSLYFSLFSLYFSLLSLFFSLLLSFLSLFSLFSSLFLPFSLFSPVVARCMPKLDRLLLRYIATSLLHYFAKKIQVWTHTLLKNFAPKKWTPSL